MSSSVEEHSQFQSVSHIEVGAHSDQQRLDNFLLSRLRGVPKSRLYRLIRKGEIRINKKRAKPDSRVSTGDIVRIPPIRVAESAPIERPSDALIAVLNDSILHESDDFIVINKPQGLSVHRGTNQAIGLIESLRWMRQGEQELFLELAHRIDRETTGCLVIAKTPKFLKYLQDEFRERRVHKVYQALVHGRWPSDLIEVNAPLLRREIAGQEKVVTVDTDAGKSAQTHFSLIRGFTRASLIEARPLTGRTHQIRVHCQYAGHAIIGDNKYTPSSKNHFAKHKRLCLHAASIEFKLPDSEQLFSTKASIHSKMSSLLDTMGPEVP
jgi:23S rRNA pseudouridine955/2504/2580 synthase